MLRRIHLVVAAALVALLVTLYPYLGAAPCDYGECPYAAQPSPAGSTGLAMVCLGAALAASVVTLAPATLRRRRRADADDRWYAQLYPSPEPYPPRLLPGR
jgi:hypothetical protein